MKIILMLWMFDYSYQMADAFSIQITSYTLIASELGICSQPSDASTLSSCKLKIKPLWWVVSFHACFFLQIFF
ncbi:hypothetical protein KC19_12G089200 [Ceratodon purpureus]|uniref:Uncharacterized protein n=1 Tax=Ceratodon purpureus TaxID=3225 RepID=A0A8T0G547_CERPU|nr:hypothetical protein KC19_12G089200 [Ceratodon purpureus]